MSGHSKWATIKRKKEKTDSQRSNVFTKITREIIVAVKAGSSGDPENNFRLRMAVIKAKDANMPNDNIQRAIKRALSQADGDNYEEVFYEGYGPGGVALLVQILTDNRNRTAGDMRYIFSRNNGNLGELGCVGWMFDQKGLITIEAETCDKDEDALFEMAIEAGAEDMELNDGEYTIYTEMSQLDAVRSYLEEQKITVKSAELSYIPQNTVEISGEQVEQFEKLVDALEDNDDVQNVYTNADINEE